MFKAFIQIGFFAVVIVLSQSCSKVSESKILFLEYSFSEEQLLELKEANQYRDAGSLLLAENSYKNLMLYSKHCRVREFSKLNHLLCKLLTNDTLFIDTLAFSKSFPNVATLINGIILTRKDFSGFDSLYKAKNELAATPLENSFYKLVVMEQLGLAYRQARSDLDSVDYYYQHALSMYYRVQNTEENRSRILYRMAQLSLLHRNEINGLAYVEEAQAIVKDEVLSVKLRITKATLLRKLNRFQESKSTLDFTEDFAKKIRRPDVQFILIRERAFYHYDMMDTVGLMNDIIQLTKLQKPESYYAAHINRMWGYYYSLTGDESTRLHKYELALKYFLKQRIRDSQPIFEALAILSQGYLKLGDLDKAQQYIYQDLVLFTKLENTSYSLQRVFSDEVRSTQYNFITYDLLGSIFLQKYKRQSNAHYLDEAFRLYTLIDSLIVKQIKMEEDESVLTFAQIGHGIYTHGIEVCYHLYQTNRSEAALDWAHRFMERSKSLLTYQDLITHNDQYFPTIPKSIKQKELELKMSVSVIKRNQLKLDHIALQKTLADLNNYYSELRKKYPEYYNARYEQSIPAFHFYSEKSNASNKSLIQYQLGEDAIFALRYDHPIQFIQVPIDSTFSNKVLALRRNLESNDLNKNDDLKSFKYYSSDLYQTLIQPLKDLKSQITLIPDGILTQIPFDVLISDTVGDYRTMPYLIKNKRISYSYSLKLSHNKSEAIRFEQILGYAFDGSSKLASLPGTAKELKSIENNLKNAQVLFRMGKDANRDQFLEDIEGPFDVVHLGLHAQSDVNNRLANRIYFHAKDEQVDTVFGYEIIPKFIKAHTVVLPMCESASGAIALGEGTFSLARAFQQTGVEHVVSSFWSLPDFSSSKIFDTFYKQLASGKIPSEALHISKLEYLQKSDQNTSAPFFWASLTCFSR